MTIIRSAIFNVLFYALFIAMMIVGLPLLVLPRASALGWVRLWARASLWLLATVCGSKVEFRNAALLPAGASIVAVKHHSFLETFALVTVLDDFAFVLKQELMAIPLFGWYLGATGQIGIDRAKKGGALLMLQRAVRDRLAAGRQVVIFPEGTRRLVGAAPVYKPGVAALYTASAAPCTPVALNTGLFWPRKSFIRRPGTIVFEFLPPIEPGLPKRAFLLALERAIEPATAALVREAISKDPRLGSGVGRGSTTDRADEDRDDSASESTPAAA